MSSLPVAIDVRNDGTLRNRTHRQEFLLLLLHDMHKILHIRGVKGSIVCFKQWCHLCNKIFRSLIDKTSKEKLYEYLPNNVR